jgi:hypothetical protein
MLELYFLVPYFFLHIFSTAKLKNLKWFLDHFMVSCERQMET